VLPGIVGSIQAVEAIKCILGAGDLLSGRLLIMDALGLSFREVAVSRDQSCPVCGDNPTQTGLIDYDVFCGADGEMAGACPPRLLDVRDFWEWDAGNLADRGALHIPLAELMDRTDELPEDTAIVTYCRTGDRSADAAERLRSAGFAVRNLLGGLKAWARDVDSSVRVA
jgi:adenylyltransferase/sulfurtransferase